MPTRSKAPLLSLAPRARSAPFVPLCPKVPDLLENQDRWLAFSDDFRALTFLGRQYHRSLAMFEMAITKSGLFSWDVRPEWKDWGYETNNPRLTVSLPPTLSMAE
jgi:hypothetical protein